MKHNLIMTLLALLVIGAGCSSGDDPGIMYGWDSIAAEVAGAPGETWLPGDDVEAVDADPADAERPPPTDTLLTPADTVPDPIDTVQPDTAPPPDETGTGGSGGAFPGSLTRSVTVPGIGEDVYYLFVPAAYDPAAPMPLLLAFHGQAGAGNADFAASGVRDHWSYVAENKPFIVVAQGGDDATGSWANDDIAILNAIIDDVFAAYNVDLTRIYGWGFSAGGHLIHVLGLQNSEFFAAYSAASGVLGAIAGDAAPAQAPRKIPVDLHVGTSDPNYPYVAADKNTFLAAGWILGQSLSYVEFNDGHTYTLDHLHEIWAFLSLQTL